MRAWSHDEPGRRSQEDPREAKRSQADLVGVKMSQERNRLSGIARAPPLKSEVPSQAFLGKCRDGQLYGTNTCVILGDRTYIGYP